MINWYVGTANKIETIKLADGTRRFRSRYCRAACPPRRPCRAW
ncbi:calcium-binding protein [Rhizobacter sp. P5_C2]